MPTTRYKNTLYRLALHFRAPRLERNPKLMVIGAPLRAENDYVRLLRKHHVMGSAALLKDEFNQVILLSSSQNPPHAVREDSLFRVASITKMAAALAVMVAVSQGKLSLGTPVLAYFQDVEDVPELESVTLAHLLSHTSGLMDPAGLEEALLVGKPFPEIIRGCRISPPGASFHYSNLGFGLAGCLLEAVYAQPVSRILKQLVFDPLGMSATLDASELEIDRIVPITRVLPWRPGNDLRITPLGAIPLKTADPLRHYGHTAGSMYLDLASLEKLMDCLIRDGAPLIFPEQGRLMQQKHAEYGKISPTLSYGLGILRIQDPSLSESLLLGHQGFAYGCADGAFWEVDTGRMILFLDGGASEARRGRLGACNYDVLRWALRKEMPTWSGSVK